MSVYPDESNWSAVQARMSRRMAELRLQNLVGPVRGIEDWPAHRVYDALRANEERMRRRHEEAAQ